MTNHELPTLFVSAKGSYTESGEPVAPIVSQSNVDRLPDGWRVKKGLGSPSLLLKPDKSFDNQGEVPTTFSGNVTQVQGQYGPAWRIVDGQVRVASTTNRVFADKGTVIVRARRFGDVSGSPFLFYVGSSNAASIVTVYHLATALRSYTREGAGTLRSPVGLPVLPLNQWQASDLRWDAATVQHGSTYSTSQSAPRVDTTYLGFGAWPILLGGATLNADIESVVVYPQRLSDAEIKRISEMGHAWEWGAAGSLVVPFRETFTSALIRCREGSIEASYYVTAQNGAARFGTSGRIERQDETIHITSDAVTEVLAVSVFGRELRGEEIERFYATPTEFLTRTTVSQSAKLGLPRFDQVRMSPLKEDVELQWTYTPESDLSHYEIEATSEFGTRRWKVATDFRDSRYGTAVYGTSMYFGTPLTEIRTFLIPAAHITDQIRIRAVSRKGLVSNWSSNDRKVPTAVLTPQQRSQRHAPHKVDVLLSPNIKTVVVNGRVEWKVGQ